MYTTYITLILIGLVCVNKFESVLLNSIVCISAYGFITISIYLLNVVYDSFSWLVGPIMHGFMGGFALFIILHPRIPISKRYLIWGFLFFIFFLPSYDTYTRINEIAGVGFSTEMTAVHSFYSYALSLLLIYYYKKKYGILLP